jgi:hypothetical protein
LYDPRRDVADPFDAEEPMKVHKDMYCLSGLPSSQTRCASEEYGGGGLQWVLESGVAGWRGDPVDVSAAAAHPGGEVKQRRPVGVLLGRGRAQQQERG